LVAAEFSSISELASVIEREHFPIALFQDWFVIERVDLADSTLHEKEDHAFCFCGVV
jgi:hypothetical protein